MNISAASSKKDKNQPDSPSKDPVCSMQPTDSITYQYEGITYKFCSDYCRQQFKENPTAYV